MGICVQNAGSRKGWLPLLRQKFFYLDFNIDLMSEGQDRVVEALIHCFDRYFGGGDILKPILGNNQDLSTILSCKKQLIGNLWFHEPTSLKSPSKSFSQRQMQQI